MPESSTPTHADAILAIIAEHGPMGPRDIAGRMDAGYATVRSTLLKMRDRGQLHQPHWGVYALSEPELDNPADIERPIQGRRPLPPDDAQRGDAPARADTLIVVRFGNGPEVHIPWGAPAYVVGAPIVIDATVESAQPSDKPPTVQTK